MIYNSDIPVGASQVRNGLGQLGIQVSEATAGRLLQELDLEGYTKKEGFQGRVLTKLGFAALKKMEMQHDRMEYGEAFFKILDGKTQKELLDVLVARKAIEREMARLAALNITPELEAEIREFMDMQNTNLQDYKQWDCDLTIHRLVAKAADNKVLETMLHIITQDIQLAPVLRYICKQVNGTFINDHRKILGSILDKKPEQAEQAMLEHIENLIKDVNRFWKKKDPV